MRILTIYRNLLSSLLILFALMGTFTGVFAQQSGSSPVKIFILAGQSNMLGQGDIAPVTTSGTLEHTVANDPAGIYQLLHNGSNWVVRDDVWIRDQDTEAGGLTVGYGADPGKVGPELGFGHAIGDLNEQQVLLVKAAWGGKSLAVDFRPPSSGGTVGFYYNEILNLVNEATTNLGNYFPDHDGGGYEIAGFLWHQGWNDRVDENHSAEYETNMANFIRDMRAALGKPNLPFVIATTGMDGGNTYTEVELAQLAMTNTTTYPDFADDVKVIDTRSTYEGLDFWQPIELSPADEGYHWNRNAKTYTNIGFAMADAMSTLAPGRSPFRPRATGGPGGVTVSWSNGTEIPTSVRILRNGVEIAAAAPTTPSSYLDTTALPGVHEYELQFAMPVSPSDPLTTNFNGGITGLTITPGPGTLTLNWSNNMGYTAIEIRRNGDVLEAALSGSATSYTDTTPPISGIVTYTVAPTTGTSTPATAEINLSLACQVGVLDPYLANGGVNPATGQPWAAGDTYRLVFVTSATTPCNSSNIDTYNTFVQNLANAADLGTSTLGPVTWKAVGSTAAVDARDNTDTNPDVDGIGVPIIRMDGTFVIANNNADLWNGINVSHIPGDEYLSVHLDENGVEVLDERVRTGSSTNGTATGDGRVFGGSAESPPRVQTGRNFAPDFYGGLGGTSWMQDWSEQAADPGRLYAISQPLTILNLADETAPTLLSITDDKPGGSVNVPGTVTYTVTFSEPMSASSIGIDDFENDPSLTTAVTILSTTPTADPAVFLVAVVTSEAGSLQLRIKAGAVLTDMAGNPLDTTSPLPDDTTITINSKALLYSLAGNGANIFNEYGAEADGYLFTTGASPLVVSWLGFYDAPNGESGALGDDLLASHRVSIWRESDGVLMAQTTVQPGDTLQGNFRGRDITPVLLAANTSYVIAADYGGEGDRMQEGNNLAGWEINGITINEGRYGSAGGDKPNSTWSIMIGPNFGYDLPPLSVSLTAPANAANFLAGAPIIASANVFEPGPFTDTVTFHLTPVSPPGPTVQMVSSGSSSPFTADLESLTAGTYEIYATVANNKVPADTAISATHTFTVAEAPPLACQLGILNLTANGGINPATGQPWAAGDTYRLVFVTSATTACTSTDITTYNTFVQGLADAAGLGTSALGPVTWKVVGSTATVDARDNTGTNPNTHGLGEPVYRMDGAFAIANNYADLWDGIVASHQSGQNFLAVHLDENGVMRLDERVRTGSSANGTAANDGRVFGGSSEDPPRVQTGRNYAPDFYGSYGGGGWMQDWSEAAADPGRVYAISGILTILSTAPTDPYQIWLGNFTFAPGDDTTPTGDPDGDGLSNQEEFAFALDPTLGSSVNPIAQQLQGNTFQYTRTQNSGLSYRIYYSTTLSGWTWDEFATQTPGPAVGGVETVTVTLDAATPIDGRLFVRVEARPTPTP